MNKHARIYTIFKTFHASLWGLLPSKYFNHQIRGFHIRGRFQRAKLLSLWSLNDRETLHLMNSEYYTLHYFLNTIKNTQLEKNEFRISKYCASWNKEFKEQCNLIFLCCHLCIRFALAKQLLPNVWNLRCWKLAYYFQVS